MSFQLCADGLKRFRKQIGRPPRERLGVSAS